jgi:ChrB-like protein
MLVYRLPREPSTPRITLWRKLRRLGAVQLLDGLVALPADARTQEALEWLADEVIEADGEASVWLSQPTTVGQQRQLESKMAEAAADEYQAVLSEAQAAADEDSGARRRTVARLRRELARIADRDHFPPPERERAHRAVAKLANSTEVTA